MAVRILFSVDEYDDRNLQFVEVENESGESIDAGEWETDENGYRVLVIEEV